MIFRHLAATDPFALEALRLTSRQFHHAISSDRLLRRDPRKVAFANHVAATVIRRATTDASHIQAAESLARMFGYLSPDKREKLVCLAVSHPIRHLCVQASAFYLRAASPPTAAQSRRLIDAAFSCAPADWIDEHLPIRARHFDAITPEQQQAFLDQLFSGPLLEGLIGSFAAHATSIGARFDGLLVRAEQKDHAGGRAAALAGLCRIAGDLAARQLQRLVGSVLALPASNRLRRAFTALCEAAEHLQNVESPLGQGTLLDDVITHLADRADADVRLAGLAALGGALVHLGEEGHGQPGHRLRILQQIVALPEEWQFHYCLIELEPALPLMRKSDHDLLFGALRRFTTLDRDHLKLVGQFASVAASFDAEGREEVVDLTVGIGAHWALEPGMMARAFCGLNDIADLQPALGQKLYDAAFAETDALLQGPQLVGLAGALPRHDGPAQERIIAANLDPARPEEDRQAALARMLPALDDVGDASRATIFEAALAEDWSGDDREVPCAVMEGLAALRPVERRRAVAKLLQEGVECLEDEEALALGRHLAVVDADQVEQLVADIVALPVDDIAARLIHGVGVGLPAMNAAQSTRFLQAAAGFDIGSGLVRDLLEFPWAPEAPTASA